MEHTVRIDLGEEGDTVEEEFREYIEQHDELQVEEPDGALGIVEIGTIVIAVAATYELATSLIRDIDELLSDSDATMANENVEETAKWYIDEHTSTEADELDLQSRNSNGPDIRLVFSDQQGREHEIVINRFDPSLSQIDYSSE